MRAFSLQAGCGRVALMLAIIGILTIDHHCLVHGFSTSSQGIVVPPCVGRCSQSSTMMNINPRIPPRYRHKLPLYQSSRQSLHVPPFLHFSTSNDNESSSNSSSDDEIEQEQQQQVEEKEESAVTNKLDMILSQLTSAFPLFVLGSAILGFAAPTTLNWVSRGNLISLMLASVMMGTGMTLEKKDFTQVLVENSASVPAGVLCQFIIMPATAFAVGRTLLLNRDPVLGPVLFLGLALVGCSPGGTASNLVSLIAKADVALSVLLTSCSTMLASVVTPLLVKLLVGSTVQVSGMALCSATAKVVLLPVIAGMILNKQAPRLSKQASRFTPFASVLLVALICGGVVSKNASSLLGSSATATSSSVSLLPWIIGSVLLLHIIGFLAGYLVPKYGLVYTEKTARTISIETGMQNSALAVVLAQSIGANPLAALPGALSATAHSCLGSILAAYWRFVDSKKESNEESTS